MSKSSKLRHLIERDELGFLMEAHDGISAKIVEETGFDAIWGSGLSMSAALGVRDNNEATWTQILEKLEFMSDHTTIPILVDGDTGYGDFNTMRRLVKKLESRDVAGVCIEDKIFPKTNSFINGTSQALAPIDEFCGKIKAGKDAQSNDDFVIVARVEAFIAGWGLSEALKRAEAYHDAGANAILMHSSQRNPSEIFAFAREWAGRSPVIIVPTKYYTTPTEAFRLHDIAAVIWANHLLRSAITAMRETAKKIYESESVIAVEDKIASVSDIFQLQGADELAEAEKRYLPSKSSQTKAIVLAFARGVEMGDLTTDRPKAMVHVGGQPILEHIADTYRAAGIRDIGVVCGYKKESVKLEGATLYDSPSEERRDEVLALSAAADDLKGDIIVSYGDVLFRKFIASELADSDADFAVMIDTSWQTSRNRDRYADYAICDKSPQDANFYDKVNLKKIVADPTEKNIHGEWMGFLKMSAKGSEICRKVVTDWAQKPDSAKNADMRVLLNRLIELGHEIQVLFTAGNWLDCDSIADAIDGGSFAQ